MRGLNLDVVSTVISASVILNVVVRSLIILIIGDIVMVVIMAIIVVIVVVIVIAVLIVVIIIIASMMDENLHKRDQNRFKMGKGDEICSRKEKSIIFAGLFCRCREVVILIVSVPQGLAVGQQCVRYDKEARYTATSRS